MTKNVNAASSEEVKPDDFLTAEEQTANSDAGEGESQPAEESEVSESDQESQETGGESTEEDQLFAGKFKNLDALKEAFANLGGDPEEISDSKQLEVAYLAAEKAFHKARQQPEAPQEEQPSADQMVEEVVRRTDFSKVANAADLMRETVKATLGLFEQQQVLRESRLVSQIQQGLETREQVRAELADLEAKVPRLKTDKPFRDAFGYFVAGQKASKQYKGLGDAFNTFIAVAKGHGESLAQSQEAQEKNKASAQVSSSGPEGLKEPKSADETIVDEIVQASKAKNALFKI